MNFRQSWADEWNLMKLETPQTQTVTQRLCFTADGTAVTYDNEKYSIKHTMFYMIFISIVNPGCF